MQQLLSRRLRSEPREAFGIRVRADCGLVSFPPPGGGARFQTAGAVAHQMLVSGSAHRTSAEPI